MRNRKVEIMYFYSNMYENEKSLSKLSEKFHQERKDIRIHLVNVEDPKNEELTELYGVNMVPVIIFLTSKGKVAARRCLPLSSREVIHEVTNRIRRGELPNVAAEETRTKVLEALKSVTRRNDLTHLIVEQVENDLMEADSDSEVYEMVSSHISALNHAINDLQEFKRVLQKFSKKQKDFIV